MDNPSEKQIYIYGNIRKCSEQQLRVVGYSWCNKNTLVSVVLLWEPTRGRRKPVQPLKSYNTQLIEDNYCTSDELRKAMENRDECKKRIMNCRESSTW